MDANDLLSLLTQLLFLVLSLVTAIDYIRYRDGIRRDVTLMFSTIAAPVLVQFFSDVTDREYAWLDTAGAFILIAQPYFLLKLTQYLRPIPDPIYRSTLMAMVVSWLLFLGYTLWPLPILTLPIIAYFVAVDGYSMMLFVRGVFNTTGVVQQRLRFAAAGSGLFALALGVAGLTTISPALTDITRPVTQLLASGSALMFYFGFVPPRWLRRLWQLSEVQRFLLQLQGKLVGEGFKVATSMSALCTAANRVTGGKFSLVVQRDGERASWQPVYASDPARLPTIIVNNTKPLEQVWHEKAALFEVARIPGQTPVIRGVDAQTALIVPIITSRQTWGLLLVFQKHRSLFIEDDLDLLTLLTQQSAFSLENNELVEQLQNNSVQLIAVNKELEAFSYSVSHDLRAPLRALDGYSQALLEDYHDQLDAEGQQCLERIRFASQRMAHLIDDLLQLSQLTRSPLEHTQVDLSGVTQEILQELQKTQPERPVDITIQPDVIANGDRRLLGIALRNLLGNAWKFTGKQAQPRIEFGQTQHNGHQAYFVRDNGAGFDMAYAHKLFGAFQRLHKATEFEGTGIGLATVQRIIHRHGGQIWAESQVEQGTTFYFTLADR